jgi:hypothetical protein
MASSLTVNAPTRTAAFDFASAVAADATGNYFTNTGVERLYVKNGGVGSITLTHVLGTNGTVDSLTPSARTTTITAGQIIILGPWPVAYYNDTNSRMNFTYSGVTSVTVAVIGGP